MKREKNRCTIEIEQSQNAEGLDFIHLIPAGRFTCVDGRGPFTLDAAAVLANAEGRRLPIDINHAIDWRSGFGDESPAYGWIIAMEIRDDGIWGQVEWTKRGKELLNDKAYGFISPVFCAFEEVDGTWRIYRLESAALCNNPALPQLKGLFTRNGDLGMEKTLMTALGLAEGATAADAVKAAQALKSAQTAHEALSKELCALAGAADEKQLMSALKAKLAAAEEGKSNLEKMVSELNGRLTAQELAAKQAKAEAFVAQALKDGKIVPALKEHFTKRYLTDPAGVELEVQSFISVNAGGVSRPPESRGGSLTAAEKEMCAAMGVNEKAFLATKQEKK